MTFNWRDASNEDTEKHFNPRVATANAVELIEMFIKRSAATREGLKAEYDIRFGPAPKQTLDLFPADNNDAGSPAPAQIFIHGGYWRALDKNDHSFVAGDIVKEGVTHLSLNYDLCPSVTLDDIVAQIRDGIVYIYKHADELGIDRNRLHLAGHSAGAHLAGMMLQVDWPELGLPADIFKSVHGISGIYEPEAVMKTSINEDVRLDTAMAQRNDVIARDPATSTGASLLVSVGGDEPEGWIDQSERYHQMLLGKGLQSELVIDPGTNHFTVLEAACTAGHSLFDKTVALIKG